MTSLKRRGTRYYKLFRRKLKSRKLIKQIIENKIIYMKINPDTYIEIIN